TSHPTVPTQVVDFQRKNMPAASGYNRHGQRPRRVSTGNQKNRTATAGTARCVGGTQQRATHVEETHTQHGRRIQAERGRTHACRSGAVRPRREGREENGLRRAYTIAGGRPDQWQVPRERVHAPLLRGARRGSRVLPPAL